MAEPKGVILRQPELQRARAMEMVALRIQGVKVADIALQFSCSEETVRKYINFAGKEGLIQKAEDRILDELVPMALNVYKTALENGDTFAARDIMANLGKMAERHDKRQLRHEDHLIEKFFEERKAKKDAEQKGTQDGDAGESTIIDVTPVPQGDGEGDGKTPSAAPKGFLPLSALDE